jgi:hypothetical protein
LGQRFIGEGIFTNGVKAMLNKAIIKALVVSTFFIASTCGGAMAENLIQTGQWSYFADTVMGGISDGSAEFQSNGSDQTIRLTGKVVTANNGGIIGVRSSISKEVAKGKTGVKLKVKGNGEQYYLHITDSSARLPWHFYQQGFESTSTWEEIKLPFESFMKSWLFLPTSINQSTIKTIGIVAYGKDHIADISVMSLEFY